MTQFEEYYGADLKLALKFLTDPYKAPEQKAEALEYLEEFINNNTKK